MFVFREPLHPKLGAIFVWSNCRHRGMQSFQQKKWLLSCTVVNKLYPLRYSSAEFLNPAWLLLLITFRSIQNISCHHYAQELVLCVHLCRSNFYWLFISIFSMSNLVSSHQEQSKVASGVRRSLSQVFLPTIWNSPQGWSQQELPARIFGAVLDLELETSWSN